MSISSLNLSGYSYNSKSLLDMLEETESESSSSSVSSGALSSYGSGTTTMAGIKQKVESLLADIDPGEDGKLTMDDIEAARDELLDGFTSTIKGDLLALGVDEDIEFTLGMDSSGALIVNSSHPDKETIQSYLDANPDLADDYEDIQTLTKFTNMAGSSRSSAAIRNDIQASNIDLIMGTDESDWFSQNSMLLRYASGTVSSYSGLNITV
ncbi:MAG: hypothetical protein AB7E47_03485 [Desulfovibrionaceae bacterium]